MLKKSFYKSGSYLNEILKFKQIYEKIKDNEKIKKNL